jgi:hypothetical protein
MMKLGFVQLATVVSFDLIRAWAMRALRRRRPRLSPLSDEWRTQYRRDSAKH